MFKFSFGLCNFLHKHWTGNVAIKWDRFVFIGCLKSEPFQLKADLNSWDSYNLPASSFVLSLLRCWDTCHKKITSKDVIQGPFLPWTLIKNFGREICHRLIRWDRQSLQAYVPTDGQDFGIFCSTTYGRKGLVINEFNLLKITKFLSWHASKFILSKDDTIIFPKIRNAM